MPTTTPTRDQQTADIRPVFSLAPLTIAVPGRTVALEVRVTAPMGEDVLPVIVLSHGHGPSNHLSSLHGYAPLANFWAAHGFLVVQPTHLDSSMLGLRESDAPEAPLFWRSRATDVSRVLDHLDQIESALPGGRGRVDRRRIAVAGHSMGGHTASLVLGARLTDPTTKTVAELSDPRVTVGLVLAGVGRGGAALSEYARAHYACFASTDFSHMSTPALVLAGDQDASEHLTVAGPAWHADPYHLAPGPKTLLTLFGAGHGLGGVSGYDAAETTDENPGRVEAVCRLTSAYLRTQLGVDDDAWPSARKDFEDRCRQMGRVESKSGRPRP